MSYEPEDSLYGKYQLSPIRIGIPHNFWERADKTPHHFGVCSYAVLCWKEAKVLLDYQRRKAMLELAARMISATES